MQILLIFFIFIVTFAGLEIYTIQLLAKEIGWFDCLALVLLTGIIGAFIARKNAKTALNNLFKGNFKSAPPARQMFDAIFFFFAAALLILPGLITDIMGILLLLPLTRNLIYRELTKGKISQHQSGDFRDNDINSSGKRDNKLESDSVIDIDAEDF